MHELHHQGADLGREKIPSLLFRLALPAILAQLINLLYNMVDRMYIGHIPDIGAAALTGVGVTMPLILCISAFAALVSMGGAPRASIMMGKGEPKEAERILGGCTAMLVLTALVLTAILQLFGRQLLLLFGASGNTIDYAWSYMRLYSLGTLFVQLSLGLNAFINAQGFARTGMLTVTIGAVSNIILDPIFIFALGMGVQGAALATVLAQGISCLWILRFLTGKQTTLRLQLRQVRLQRAVILPCLALGISPFIMQFTESILNVCFNTSLLQYGGDVAVGAMTILASVMQFCMLPLQGLTQGAQPIVGFDQNNQLVVGTMTGQECLDRGIRDAVSFGPTFIVNGKAMEVAGSGGGLNPRTVLGQRADGAVLMLVIDGRQSHSIGATYKDCIDVMLQYGAVNAANLDGGSSSMLVYNGEVQNVCASLYGSRPLPTAFIVTQPLDEGGN